MQEDLGIIAGARASLYFDGKWENVDMDEIVALSEKGTVYGSTKQVHIQDTNGWFYGSIPSWMRKSALKGVLEFTDGFYQEGNQRISPEIIMSIPPMYRDLKTLPFMLLLVLEQSVRIRKVCITLSAEIGPPSQT